MHYLVKRQCAPRAVVKGLRVVHPLHMAKPKSRKTPKFRKGFFREWRKHAGLRQEQVAARIGKDRTTISRLENGEIGYTQEHLELLAPVYGTKPGVLVERPPSDRDDDLLNEIYKLNEDQRRTFDPVVAELIR